MVLSFGVIQELKVTSLVIAILTTTIVMLSWEEFTLTATISQLVLPFVASGIDYLTILWVGLEGGENFF
jgi:hypothetical protein